VLQRFVPDARCQGTGAAASLAPRRLGVLAERIHTPNRRFRVHSVLAQSGRILFQQFPVLFVLTLVASVPWIVVSLYESALVWIPAGPTNSSMLHSHLWGRFFVWCIGGLARAFAVALVIRATYLSIRGDGPLLATDDRNATPSASSLVLVVVVLAVIAAILLAACLMILGRMFQARSEWLRFAPQFIIGSYVGYLAMVAPFFAAIPAAALEGRHALLRSVVLTKDRCLGTFALLLLLHGMDWIAHQLIDLIGLGYPVRLAAGLAFDVVFLSFCAVVFAVAYRWLRFEKEGMDAAQLDEIFQ